MESKISEHFLGKKVTLPSKKHYLHSLCSMSEGYMTKKGLREVFNGAKNLKHFLSLITWASRKTKIFKLERKSSMGSKKTFRFHKSFHTKGKKKLKTLPIYLPQAAQEKMENIDRKASDGKLLTHNFSFTRKFYEKRLKYKEENYS